jgi:hypothetical protein
MIFEWKLLMIENETKGTYRLQDAGFEWRNERNMMVTESDALLFCFLAQSKGKSHYFIF